MKNIDNIHMLIYMPAITIFFEADAMACFDTRNLKLE